MKSIDSAVFVTAGGSNSNQIQIGSDKPNNIPANMLFQEHGEERHNSIGCPAEIFTTFTTAVFLSFGPKREALQIIKNHLEYLHQKCKWVSTYNLSRLPTQIVLVLLTILKCVSLSVNS